MGEATHASRQETFANELRPALERRLRRVLPGETARDAAQEVLEVFWRRYGERIGEHGPEDIAKRVATIARHKIREHCRRVYALRSRETDSELDICARLVAPRIPGDAAHLTLIDLSRLIDQMSRVNRQIMKMVAWRFTYDEIAECTGLTPMKVRSRVYFLRQHLKKALDVSSESPAKRTPSTGASESTARD